MWTSNAYILNTMLLDLDEINLECSHTLILRPICASACVYGRVPDLQSGGCRFESRSRIHHTKVYSTFRPSGVGKCKWLIPTADERVGVQVKL